MWRLDREEEQTIQYIVAVAMIIFGMVLCMMGFWVSPVGEISTSVLGALGQILLLVGAIFHINLNWKNKESHFETTVDERLKHIEDKIDKKGE